MENINEENSEEMRVLGDEIEQLQSEVAALKVHLQDKQKNIMYQLSGQMQEAMLFMCGRGQERGKAAMLSRLKEEVEELEEDLKQQTQMNGIRLKSCATKILQSSGSKLVQQKCISGHCSQVDFQLEFQLSEVKEGQGSKRKINDLNVVMDANDLWNLSSFLSGVEEYRSLLLFFKTLRTFSNRCDDRSRTFQHFQEKYPSVVSLPGGCRADTMTLSHPELPGCVLVIHWSVEVSKEGGVTPKIDLLTKVPERALQLPSQPVGVTAEAFQSLLRILGPEAAIESVISALSLSPKT